MMVWGDPVPMWRDEVRWMMQALWQSTRLLRGSLAHKHWVNLTSTQLLNGQWAESICNVDMLDKGTIHVPSGMMRDFIMLLRTKHNLKLMNYFMNFPFNSFGVHLVVTNHRGWECGSGHYCTTVMDSVCRAESGDSVKCLVWWLNVYELLMPIPNHTHWLAGMTPAFCSPGRNRRNLSTRLGLCFLN